MEGNTTRFFHVANNLKTTRDLHTTDNIHLITHSFKITPVKNVIWSTWSCCCLVVKPCFYYKLFIIKYEQGYTGEQLLTAETCILCLSSTHTPYAFCDSPVAAASLKFLNRKNSDQSCTERVKLPGYRGNGLEERFKGTVATFGFYPSRLA